MRLRAILLAFVLTACGATYWLREIERAEGLQVGALQAQGASPGELDRLGAATCNGFADRYASLAQQVLALRADAAVGRRVDLPKAEDEADEARRKMDAVCGALGIRPAPVPVAVHRDIKPDMGAAGIPDARPGDGAP